MLIQNSAFVAAGTLCLTVVLAGCGLVKNDAAKASDNAKEPPKEAVDASAELRLDYAILLEDGDSLRRINEKFRFHSGDRFRIQVRPGFASHLYLFNRSPHKSTWKCLYPGSGAPEAIALPAEKVTTLPGNDDWYRVDGASGVEYVVLIAAAYPLPDFALIEKEMSRDDFDERIALLERDFRPASSRRFEDKEWVKLFASRAPKTVIVQRLPLDHR